MTADHHHDHDKVEPKGIHRRNFPILESTLEQGDRFVTTSQLMEIGEIAPPGAHLSSS